MTFNLPVGSFAFRFWMLFAIPASILTGNMIYILISYSETIGKKFKVRYILSLAILIFIVFGIWNTSGLQKFQVNTATWGPGQAWTSGEEVQGYVWLKNLPVNTRIYDFRDDGFIIGFDKFSCAWCEGIRDYRTTFAYENITDIHSWLKKHDYEYAILGGMSIQRSEGWYGEKGPELIQKKIEEFASSDLFQVAHQTKGMLLFKIV